MSECPRIPHPHASTRGKPPDLACPPRVLTQLARSEFADSAAMATTFEDKGLEIRGNSLHKNSSLSFNYFAFSAPDWRANCSFRWGRLAFAKASDSQNLLRTKYASVNDL
jgi:hypothetical protein